MQIAKVIGNITSISKVEELKSAKLFLVQMLDCNFKLIEKFSVAVDTIGVGYKDIVLISTGSAARIPEISKDMSIDASIIARIDYFSD